MKNIWENPEIQGINRLPMRSPLIPFNNENKATDYSVQGVQFTQVTDSSFVKSLDGSWQFSLLNEPQMDENPEYKNWTQSSFEDYQWKSIQIPGAWSLQGFDKPHYTNVQMPFDTVPPYVPKENPCGLYRQSFEFPSEWKNRRIVLHVGSAESVLIVYVNGKEVGVSKDTRLPCEFDITPFIEWQANKAQALICFKVIRYSDASYVEDQDQWWFGGIHRSVYVYSTEKTFIQDIEALTRIEVQEDAMATGIIPLVVTLGHAEPQGDERFTNEQLDSLTRVVKYTVNRLEGSPSNLRKSQDIARGKLSACFDYRNTLNQVRQTIKLPNVAMWTNETPNLYVLTISLYEQEGDKKSSSDNNLRHIESTSCTIGFKSVEVCNRELRFNGKMVYIHGINRHEHNEYNGKTLTTQEMLQDIYLLKQYNFNAVRTCHYPDDQRWYDLCDRYGIYVLDEANIENHAYYDPIPRSDQWSYAYMTRVQRMFRRDKNHACIFGWSLGNESGDGANHVACQAWIRHVDPTRIVHYEGFVRDEWKQSPFSLQSLARGKGKTDLICPMYPSIDLIVEYAQKCEDYRPLIMCEYSHAMGNANGSLADYWHAIEANHGLQGGFIWDWIDQGISSVPQNDEANPKKYWKYGGDFGDSPTDYNFCLNGLLFPDQSPKPAMQECKRLFAPARLTGIHPKQGIFQIENRFDFTTLDCLALEWQLSSNGQIILKGTMPLPAIKPSEKTSIIIEEIKHSIAQHDGSEVYFTANFVYTTANEWRKAGDICTSDQVLVCKAFGNQVYKVATKTKLSCNELQQLADNFTPVLFRALLENEGIKSQLHLIHAEPQPWSFAEKPTVEWLDNDLEHIHLEKKTDSLFELFSGTNAIKKQKLGTFTKKVSPLPDEGLSIELLFDLNHAISEYPRIGISVPIPSEFENIHWYGCGPHENYSDRSYSALIAMHQKPIATMFVPYIVPQEAGTRTKTKFLQLSGANKSLQIQSSQDFSFNICPYTISDLFSCTHTSSLTNLATSSAKTWMLTLDLAHRGVGTGACGPDTQEKYRLRAGIYALKLTLK
ncbi:MAG: glycoside hydrolase family 2 TIM barrel-domain containing protein [Treponemataceae bacterium]